MLKHKTQAQMIKKNCLFEQVIQTDTSEFSIENYNKEFKHQDIDKLYEMLCKLKLYSKKQFDLSPLKIDPSFARGIKITTQSSYTPEQYVNTINDLREILSNFPGHIKNCEKEQLKQDKTIEELRSKLCYLNELNFNDFNGISEIKKISDIDKVEHNDVNSFQINDTALNRMAANNFRKDKSDHLNSSPEKNKAKKHLNQKKKSSAELTSHKFDQGTELYNRKKLNLLLQKHNIYNQSSDLINNVQESYEGVKKLNDEYLNLLNSHQIYEVMVQTDPLFEQDIDINVQYNISGHSNLLYTILNNIIYDMSSYFQESNPNKLFPERTLKKINTKEIIIFKLKYMIETLIPKVLEKLSSHKNDRLDIIQKQQRKLVLIEKNKCKQGENFNSIADIEEKRAIESNESKVALKNLKKSKLVYSPNKKQLINNSKASEQFKANNNEINN